MDLPFVFLVLALAVVAAVFVDYALLSSRYAGRLMSFLPFLSGGSGRVRHRRADARVPRPRAEPDALRHVCAPGQDPAYVLAALDHHGIAAHGEMWRGQECIVIANPGGKADLVHWREEVRRAIASADRSMVDAAHRDDPVVFLGEGGVTRV